MAELTEVLGTLLKGVTHSRVISDVFSREVSVEYQQDEILSNFPVPRVDIKETSIDLKFAVNQVKRKEVDQNAIINEQISVSTREIGRNSFEQIILAHPQKNKLLELDKEKKLNLASQLPVLCEQIMRKNTNDVADAINGKTQSLAKKIIAALSREIFKNADFKKLLLKGSRVGDINKRLTVIVNTELEAFVANVNTAVRNADRQATTIDIAVTKAELTEMPEEVMSKINVVAEIRNYEWTDIEGEEGKLVPRLREE